MGSSAAYWLKQHPEGRKLNVVVVERDPKVNYKLNFIKYSSYINTWIM